jgi:Flp pilus assembly protein CpaB
MGPWEPEVQRVVADVGLATFNEVQARTRATIERMVAFGMRRQPLEILQIAQRRGRLDVACRHVADNKHVTDLKWITLCEKGRTT